MYLVRVSRCPRADKEAVFRRFAFLPELLLLISLPLTVSSLQNLWLEKRECHKCNLAEAITRFYDRILHVVLSQLDPCASDAERLGQSHAAIRVVRV